MNRRGLLFLLLTFFLSATVSAQDISVDVSYKMKKHPAFKFKVGRPVEMAFNIYDDTYQIEPISKDLKQWEIRSNGYFAEARFFMDEGKGIWWEIASSDVVTKVLISKDYTDLNDPREFLITSTADRGRFMVFNEEPDCNSEFTLIEPADSPTLLTGVMRTYGSMKSNDPCEKGKWTIDLKYEPMDHVLIGWMFASIQSMNVRFMNDEE